MALGTGLLIGSVSFELIDEALKTRTVGWVALLVLVGAAFFTVGDWLLDRHGASERKDPTGAQADGSPLAIVLGSVLDGIPESFVLGLTVLQGGVSLPLLAGVSLSNLPEGMSSSSGLKGGGSDNTGCRAAVTSSLPSRFRGNWSQPMATVLACFRRFRGLFICHQLPLVAPARLHKRSILSAQIRDEKTDVGARVPDRRCDHLL